MPRLLWPSCVDNDQRHTFRAISTAWRAAAGVAGSAGGQLPLGRSGGVCSGRGARPRSTPRGAVITQKSGPTGSWTRSSSQGRSSSQPHPSIIDLAAASALAATDEQGAAAVIEIGLGQRERFLDAQPCPSQNDDRAAYAADGARRGRGPQSGLERRPQSSGLGADSMAGRS
jgi:hypothetical protein